MEKTAEELQREIDELHRQQREITERLRDPRGLRRGGLTGAAPRNFASNGARHRGFLRAADRNDMEDEPPAKRRLSSAVVKVGGGEVGRDGDTGEDLREKQFRAAENLNSDQSGNKSSSQHRGAWFQGDTNQRMAKKEPEALTLPEPAPRILPKNEDPSLVNRNRRMLGQLLGTLEKFRNEDKQLSGTDAFARRSTAMQRAEQKAREEGERLRQQEREHIAERRRRDLTLRARVAAKAEQKKLELLFLQWTKHQKKLGSFIRTKAEPPIYYMLAKPLEEGGTMLEQQKEQAFLEWKAARREELNQYQKEIEEQYLANVEKELERWQNVRKANSKAMNLQETMDEELETHRMKNGLKKRKIPGAGDENNNEDEEDDMEDEMMMDDVLGDAGDRNLQGADVVVAKDDTADAETGGGGGNGNDAEQSSNEH